MNSIEKEIFHYETQARNFILGLTFIVNEGFPSSYPYKDGTGYYEIFRPCIKDASDEGDLYENIEDAFKELKKAIIGHLANKTRIIVRRWPEFCKIGNSWKVYCRLIADDGTKELETNLSTKKEE
jgi:hypothetical protein